MKNKKRVTLMYPNFDWTESISRTKWLTQPYNIGILAAMIEKDYDIRMIDANLDNLSEDRFARLISEDKPNILGISLTTNEYTNSGFVAAKIVKENSPETKIVVGGVSAISNPYPIIENPYVDVVVAGEGEYVFKELCDFFTKGGKFPEKGVLYKERDKIKGGGRVDFIQDLNALPLPAYHLIEFNRYANQIQRESVERPRAMPYARIITSRGCPFNCSFCEVGNISGKKIRYKSLEKITEEIEWLMSDYDIKTLCFDDDNLFFNKKRAKSLLETMIDRKYNLKWNDHSVAVFSLDEEMISLMKESGCEFAGIAIESGNKRVSRNLVHKPIDLDKAKKTIEIIKKYGIDLSANFIVGFPGETWDEIRETFRFAEEINVDYVKLFIATPLPNTELYEMAKKGNYLKEGFEFNKHLWTDGWLQTDEFRAQDLKILRAYEWDRINFSLPEKRKKIAKMMGITEERLNQIRKETLKRANP